MQKVKKHTGIRIFFLVLFWGYFADITFFTHSHIIHGVTIVHSHFSCPIPANKDTQSSRPDKAMGIKKVTPGITAKKKRYPKN